MQQLIFYFNKKKMQQHCTKFCNQKNKLQLNPTNPLLVPEKLDRLGDGTKTTHFATPQKSNGSIKNF